MTLSPKTSACQNAIALRRVSASNISCECQPNQQPATTVASTPETPSSSAPTYAP